jgi:hypothetical protein
MFGPWAQASLKSEDVPPFYISLTIHDMFLHNAMFDLGASHNLMPRTIMEGLGLDITKPYKDLFSFDSKQVKCLGLIKDMVVSLHQITEKNLVMDVVMADVPPKFGMLLSRSWEAKLKGTLQMDLSYAMIPIFGTLRRLYREKRLAYMINNRENPENHPIYFVDTNMGSSMLFNEVVPQKDELEPEDSGSSEPNYQSAKTNLDSGPDDAPSTEEPNDGWWCMSFDGAVGKEGAGAGVLIKPPTGDPKMFSYKLHFKCTNNVAEYEALVLGIKVLKDLQVQRVNIQGDS